MIASVGTGARPFSCAPLPRAAAAGFAAGPDGAASLSGRVCGSGSGDRLRDAGAIDLAARLVDDVDPPVGARGGLAARSHLYIDALAAQES